MMTSPTSSPIITFVVEGQTFPLARDRIPAGSWLEQAIGIVSNQVPIEVPLTIQQFEPVYQYLLTGSIPEGVDVALFIQTINDLLISPLESYVLANLSEEDMRAHMYQPGYENHPMNTDPYYGLVDVVPELWEQFRVNRPADDNLLFNQGRIEPQSWPRIFDSLSELNFLFQVPGLFIAGGRIFSALFDGGGDNTSRRKPGYSDVDLFLYASTEEEAIQKITQIKNLIKYHFEDILRTKPQRDPPPNPPPEVIEMTEEEQNEIRERTLEGYVPFEEQDNIEEQIRRDEHFQEVNRRNQEQRAAFGSPEQRQAIFNIIHEADPTYDLSRIANSPLVRLKSELSMVIHLRLAGDYQEIRRTSLYKGDMTVSPDERFRVDIDQPSDSTLSGQTYDLIFTRYRTIEFHETRSANTVTISCNELDFQIVLRLYRSPSEVLHGFDVDCCALGYDGSHIWATQRALFSLLNGYNTVNFDRLSPSYPFRLVKYALRGMSVYVPNFSRSRINEPALLRRFQQYWNDRYAKRGYRQYRKFKGLDVLLYSEYHWRRLDQNEKVTRSLTKMASELSDYNYYDPLPYSRYFDRDDIGQTVFRLLEHLIDTADVYPEYSVRYMPHVRALLEEISPPPWPDYAEIDMTLIMEFTKHIYNSIYSLKINNFLLRTNPIFFVTGDQIQEILEINPHLYEIFRILTNDRVEVPQRVAFKVTQPGEQMTNTFNQLVLEDNRVWYQGEFYNLPE